MDYRSARVCVFLLAAMLAACSSPLPQRSTSAPAANAGRYEMENDSGVLEPIDLARVRQVEPKRETRTLAGNKSPYTINGRTYRVLENETGYTETGMASWYGRKFHGHLTSNGEVYDMFQLSAAHTTLPIPSYIRVTNLDNGKSIIARVNDRGPFHPGRIVDMSYAGAVMLGYADRGTARVRVEAIVPDTAPPSSTAVQAISYAAGDTLDSVATERVMIEENRGQEFLQVGAFSSLDSAQGLVARLTAMTTAPVMIKSESNSAGVTLHKVRIGPLTDDGQARQLIETVQAARLGTPFRVRI
jgi:rare lipoprotein A